MIKLISSLPDKDLCDPFYIKIAASAKAYGFMRPFCMFWRTNDTIICRIDDRVTIYGEDFVPDELHDFLIAIGAKSCTCCTSAAKKLGFSFTENDIMRCDGGMAINADFYPSPDTVLTMLKNGCDGDIDLPDDKAFIADISHRTRHGTAASCVYKSAVCTAPYITAAGALLCGAATAPADRGKGFGGLCVSALVRHIGKPCFLFCDDSLSSLYKRFGFVSCGRVAFCRII